MAPSTHRLHLRLTDADYRIITAVTERHGVSETDAVRMALRALAREEGITMDKPRIHIHWTITMDPANYGDNATEAEVAAYVEREEREIAVYVANHIAGATVETQRVPETESYNNRAWVRVDGIRYSRGDDDCPTDVLNDLWELVAANWTDWLPQPQPTAAEPVRGYHYEQLTVEIEDGEVMTHDSMRNYGGMPTDLASEVRELAAAGTVYEYYAVTWTVDDRPEAEGGNLLWVPEAGRAGICAGGDSTWDDADSVEDALDHYVVGDWGE